MKQQPVPNIRDMKGRVDKAQAVAYDTIEDLDDFSIVEVHAWVLETLLKKIHAEEEFSKLMCEEVRTVEGSVLYMNKRDDIEEWKRVAAMLYKSVQCSPIGYTFDEWMDLGEQAVKAYEELTK
jgi:hypothetical protein